MSEFWGQTPSFCTIPQVSPSLTARISALQNVQSSSAQVSSNVPQQASWNPTPIASVFFGTNSSVANAALSGHSNQNVDPQQMALDNLRMFSDYCTMGVHNIANGNAHASSPTLFSPVEEQRKDPQTRVQQVSQTSSRLAVARRHLREAKKERAPTERRVIREDPQRLREIARMVSQQSLETRSDDRAPFVDNSAVTIFHSHGSQGQSSTRLGELHAKAAAGPSGGRLDELIAHAKVTGATLYPQSHVEERGPFSVPSFPQEIQPGEEFTRLNPFRGIQTVGYNQHGLGDFRNGEQSLMLQSHQQQQQYPEMARPGYGLQDLAPFKKEHERKTERECKPKTTRPSQAQKVKLPPIQTFSTQGQNRGNAQSSDPSIPHLVMDTCSILYASQAQLQGLIEKNVLCIPFSVVKELDNMIKKARNKANKVKGSRQLIARRIRDWISSVMNEKNVRLQQRSEVIQAFEAKGTNNDDSILGFAVFLSRKESRKVLFVSEDKILRIKATAELGASYEFKKILSLESSEPKTWQLDTSRAKGRKKKKRYY